MKFLGMKLQGLWLVVVLLMFLSACKHDPDPIIDDSIVTSPICYEDTIYFQNDILPMLLGTCGTSGCHDLGTAKHGVVLVDYLSVMRTGGVNIANPASSDIYQVLSGSDERMPPSPRPQWTDLQKNALLTWISQGAINNECLNQAVCDTSNVTFNGSVLPLFDKYCLSCHSGANPQYNLDLTNFDQLAAIIENGSLLGSINHEPGYYAMPKESNQLTPCEIRTIEIWVNDTVIGGGGGGGTGHPCSPDSVYFANDILPLLVSNCSTSGCHDQASAQEGVVLVDYASIISKVHPGDAANSKLYKVLIRSDERMPPPPASLTTAQIQSVQTWINQGALYNVCDAPCDTLNVTYSQSVWPVIQTNCTGCHSGANPGAGIVLTDHATISAAAATGKLYGSVAHLSGYAPMPKNASQLSECNVAAIRIWIENGTPND